MPSPAPAPVQFGLSGRVIVVTGAAQGIGAACAQRLAYEGARLALWDVDADGAQTLASSLQLAGGEAIACPCDVSRQHEVAEALQATLAAFGRIDGLVNNAGIFRAADFLAVTEADWDAVMDVNLKGAFLCGQAVARQMVTQGRDHHGRAGEIVNMSSVNGSLAIASIASYNASKGGINQLTRAMSLALADHGIRVNAVAPGTIATELARKAVLTSEEARQRVLGRTPMKRLGDPAEVADVVAFLLSHASRYMTGEIVHVDGGRMALNYTVPI
jgi:NAD(P)-dependent dehydrogenase (short-subunit alcohol dehydrogenase family)